MKIESVTSTQNKKIKDLQTLLEKSRARGAAGLFVVEGQRELGHCLDAGFVPETLFVCGEVIARGLPGVRVNRTLFGHPHSDSLTPAEGVSCAGAAKGLSRVGAEAGHLIGNIEGKSGLEALVARAEALNPGLTLVQIPAFLYEKVAYRGSTEGIIAEMKARPRRLEDLNLGPCPLVMVLESVEKPGNLGAVLRSADAAGADAVIICDPLTDIWNPNLIRSSVGAVFTVQTAVCSSAQAIDFLKKHGIRILTAQLQDSDLYCDSDMRSPVAIVMGTESTGLTPLWREAADAHIRIPMLGKLDSLNVSVSAAVLLYEAVRQRTI